MTSPNARFLDTGAAPAAWNMAVDEVLLAGCRSHLDAGGAAEDAPFTFRVYGWSPPALTLGRNQAAGRDVFIGRLREEGVDLCRRLTGGRAVLHDREVTYSVAGPEGLLGATIEESYRRISEGLAAGLRRLGVPVEFAPPSGRAYASQPSCFATASVWELSIGGRKVAGSAQCREGGAILQHGSILLRAPGVRLASLLRVRTHGEGEAARASADHAVGLSDVLGREVSYGEAVRALREGMSEIFGPFREGSLTDDEMARAGALAARRYANPEWTHGQAAASPS